MKYLIYEETYGDATVFNVESVTASKWHHELSNEIQNL
jgi:hypothetical protein